MTIVQQGQINTNALIVPDLIVQIVPPSWTLLNGVPTNVLGIVGTATWGPVNSPTIASGVADTASQFGQMQARKYDLGTAVAAAALQGAANFRLVRVTDGTDAAASGTAGTGIGITFTGKYTGSLGNSLSVIISAGTNSTSGTPTFKVTASLPGQLPEVFDNIGGTGNAIFVNMANAINLGQSGLRGPSQIIVATAGSGTTAPTVPLTVSMSGGIDGAATITASVLIGLDTIPRKGMYALRGTGASIAMLADADDSTQWSAQVAYGLSEGTYMILTGPAGDTISNAVTVKGTAGIDSYAAKLLFGDWVYINDNVNNQVRLISPQGFVAGILANLSPEQSSLNKQMLGIVGTQKSYANQQYSNAELQSLGQAGIDVIANPVPGGKYFGARFGHNTSSNAVVHGDNYTRMTNYIASSLNAGMGIYIGKLISPTEMQQAKATLDSFFANMSQQGMIQEWKVVLDLSNNPQSRTALGYQQADVKVRYLAINEVFLVNVEGGQSVVVNRGGTAPAF
ncbi:phage tail protein [Limnoglobus roseus]|uniref:Phage tail protein n=1 Tax=Limnoglobus roseus TaxID=2598579 RepID=A0A5C1AKM9_9BACT|nr:phage tail protein [Limnoglobus roseus]QEL18717.1 phage tail protein [Limnoglobus roseus]